MKHTYIHKYTDAVKKIG